MFKEDDFIDKHKIKQIFIDNINSTIDIENLFNELKFYDIDNIIESFNLISTTPEYQNRIIAESFLINDDCINNIIKESGTINEKTVTSVIDYIFNVKSTRQKEPYKKDDFIDDFKIIMNIIKTSELDFINYISNDDYANSMKDLIKALNNSLNNNAIRKKIINDGYMFHNDELSYRISVDQDDKVIARYIYEYFLPVSQCNIDNDREVQTSESVVYDEHHEEIHYKQLFEKILDIVDLSESEMDRIKKYMSDDSNIYLINNLIKKIQTQLNNKGIKFEL
jgi:hypothetical protein